MEHQVGRLMWIKLGWKTTEGKVILGTTFVFGKFRKLKVEADASSSPFYTLVGLGRMWFPEGKGQEVNRGKGRETPERMEFPGFYAFNP